MAPTKAPAPKNLETDKSRIALPKITFKKKSQIIEPMEFNRGDHVEVASKEEGFLGSYFEAIIMCPTPNKEYIVQYKTLLKDDLSGPLKEVVTLPELRPVPRQIPVNGFDLYDQVDAFDNDGWWVGKVTGKVGDKYLVYFETFGVACVYDEKDVRVHQDWIDGKWICSNETTAMGV